VSTNLAGLPAISVPAGLSEEDLPLGLQLIGPAFSEERLFQVARVIEESSCFRLSVD
jgi:aspartyl-tRNA(Asn)/glutamyl-tRNA(Gln) amidotransferase subunit A